MNKKDNGIIDGTHPDFIKHVNDLQFYGPGQRVHINPDHLKKPLKYTHHITGIKRNVIGLKLIYKDCDNIYVYLDADEIKAGLKIYGKNATFTAGSPATPVLIESERGRGLIFPLTVWHHLKKAWADKIKEEQ